MNEVGINTAMNTNEVVTMAAEIPSMAATVAL